LSQGNVKIAQLFKQFNTSILEKSVDQLLEINRQIVSFSDEIKSSSTTTVYRAQLISQKDLAMIKANSNALFAVQAFILASRSLSSIVKICRQATDNQLAVVLLELNLSEKASVMHIPNTDLVVFKLGTLFRLVSTAYAPDNVLHVQLEYANNAMQYIKHRLHRQIRHPLNWLTFGSYLEALKQPSAAEAYYKYLVTIIPDHPNIAAVCDNMDQILTTPQEAAEVSIDDPLLEQLPSSDVGTEQIQVLRKMADISYQRQDYKTALDFYRQAMELDDPQWEQFYQYKIDTLSHFYCPQVSCKKN
jgi:tetratricopeptide (TPR) repeat protein